MLTRLIAFYVLFMAFAVFALTTFARGSVETAAYAILSGGAALYNGRALFLEIERLQNPQPVRARAKLVMSVTAFFYLVGLSILIWQISLVPLQVGASALDDVYASVGFGLLALGAVLACLLPRVGNWTTGF